MENKEKLGPSQGQSPDFSTLSEMPAFVASKQDSIDTLIGLGYEADDARNITLAYGVSDLKDSTLSNNIGRNFVFLQELGYSQDDVIKMTKSLPSIYNLSIENMRQKISDMQELGYSQDDVIKMTKLLPSIYSYSIENMRQKISDMQELGYSQDDVIKMTKLLPNIYGYSIENMRQKINFYDSINMHDLAIIDAKQLMQGTALSYARYQFLSREKQIDININNYRLLFLVQAQFKKRYGYSNDEIKQKYPYGEGEQ